MRAARYARDAPQHARQCGSIATLAQCLPPARRALAPRNDGLDGLTSSECSYKPRHPVWSISRFSCRQGKRFCGWRETRSLAIFWTALNRVSLAYKFAQRANSRHLNHIRAHYQHPTIPVTPQAPSLTPPRREPPPINSQARPSPSRAPQPRHHAAATVKRRRLTTSCRFTRRSAE